MILCDKRLLAAVNQIARLFTVVFEVPSCNGPSDGDIKNFTRLVVDGKKRTARNAYATQPGWSCRPLKVNAVRCGRIPVTFSNWRVVSYRMVQYDNHGRSNILSGSDSKCRTIMPMVTSAIQSIHPWDKSAVVLIVNGPIGFILAGWTTGKMFCSMMQTRVRSLLARSI